MDPLILSHRLLSLSILDTFAKVFKFSALASSGANNKKIKSSGLSSIA